MNLSVWLAVAFGGMLGTLARWQLSLWLRLHWPSFPWGTLAVNVSGSFIIGFAAAWCAARPAPDWLRLGLMTGLMGGFTTFSAFTLDTLELWRDASGAAIANIAANLVLGLAACLLGLWAARVL